MPGTPTPNLNLIVPQVGGDNNIWGGELNTDLGIIDGLAVTGTSAQVASFIAFANPINDTQTFRVTTGTGMIVATLPLVSACTGKIIIFKKVDAGVGSLVISNGTIDGQSSYSLSNQWQYVAIQSSGATWDVIANN